MKTHKVKIVATNADKHSIVGVCEYCGKAAIFYGSQSKTDVSEGLGECPNSPDYTQLIGTEVISLIQRIGSKSFFADKE